MPYAEHPLFKQKYSDSYRVWRYISIPSLVSMLDRRQIHFTSADKLNDPYEGYLGIKGIEGWSQIFNNIPVENRGPDFETLIKMPEESRKEVFLNCWHGNTHESMAMWKLYTNNGDGIAISTTLGSLKECFKPTPIRVYVTDVKYINHESDVIDWRNVLNPFIYKNECYEYEKEIRAVIWQPGISIPEKDITKAGFYVDVNLDLLLKEIIISPLCPNWFFDVVMSICKKYNVSETIVQKSKIGIPSSYY